MRYIYDAVTSYGEKSGECSVCGKKATRKRVFTNTINPFNRNEDGTVRTPEQVQANVDRLRDEWLSQQVMHARCES